VEAQPEPTIERVATDADLDAVAALEARCFRTPWTREMLARELRQSDVARIYVLHTREQRVAAYCACWVILDELHINKVAVDPARRREGLALRLVRHVCAEAAAAGARRATLEVRRSNQAALALYRRLGFTVSAVRPRYYTEPEEDGLILWREGLDEPAGGPEPAKKR
jgi:ribosomal-protein-alanine N-acetyltransferase